VTEDELPLHARKCGRVRAVEILDREARATAACRHLEPELLGILALRMEVCRQDASLRIGRGPEYDRPGTVAEDHFRPRDLGW
jgi:hypothetical protein